MANCLYISGAQADFARPYLFLAVSRPKKKNVLQNVGILKAHELLNYCFLDTHHLIELNSYWAFHIGHLVCCDKYLWHFYKMLGKKERSTRDHERKIARMPRTVTGSTRVHWIISDATSAQMLLIVELWSLSQNRDLNFLRIDCFALCIFVSLSAKKFWKSKRQQRAGSNVQSQSEPRR